MPDILIEKDTLLADGRVIPAGTVIEGVPVGLSKRQLLTKLNKSGTGARVATRNALAGVVNTVTGIPDLMMNTGAWTINKAARIPQAVGEGAAALRNLDFGHFGTTPPLINNPPLGQRHYMPDANSIFAGAQVAGEKLAQMDAIISGNDNARNVPRTTFADAKTYQQNLSQAGREQFSGSALLGDALGGGAALVGIRAPIAAHRGISQLNHVNNVKAASELAKKSANAVANSPTLSAATNEALKQSTALRTLANRAGRAGEAGLEGVAVALLSGGDPLEIAGYAAGGQAAGSLLLGGITKVGGNGDFGSKVGRLTTAAVLVGGMIQLVKTATPGGEDSVLESIKSGFEKVTLGLALGAVSGIAGAGRITNRFPVKALPQIADGITAMNRGAAISVLNEALKDRTVEKVVNKLQSDAEYFGPTATAELNRAFFSEKIQVRDTIDKLMQNKGFAEKMENL
jgi:hypothetical protein